MILLNSLLKITKTEFTLPTKSLCVLEFVSIYLAQDMKQELHETNYFCNIGDKIRYFCLKNLIKIMLLINKFIDRYNN